MKNIKICLTSALFLLALAPFNVLAQAKPFVGEPKTRVQLLSCDVVISKWSKKTYYKGKDDRIIRSMAHKWAICKAPEPQKQALETFGTKTEQKTQAQLQLELEALNMRLYGNPLGPVSARTPATPVQEPIVTRKPTNNTPVNTPMQSVGSSKPEIQSFTASAGSVGRGERMTFTWSTKNATVCALTETPTLTVPFTGYLPNTSVSTALEGDGLKTLYLTCADKDWNTVQRNIKVNVTAPQNLNLRVTQWEDRNDPMKLFIKAEWDGAQKGSVTCKSPNYKEYAEGAPIYRNNLVNGHVIVESLMGWNNYDQSVCVFNVDGVSVTKTYTYHDGSIYDGRPIVRD